MNQYKRGNGRHVVEVYCTEEQSAAVAYLVEAKVFRSGAEFGRYAFDFFLKKFNAETEPDPALTDAELPE